MSQQTDTYIFPMSFSQKSLWLIDRLNPGGGGYNISRNLRLSGELNLEALEKSINKIIERHEILRTNFGESDGEPIQIVKPFEYEKLKIVEKVSALNENIDAELLNLLETESVLSFDLENERLIRFKLFKLGDRLHFLSLNLHHIIADGWSMGIFVRELSDFYEDFCRKSEIDFGELPIQYGDYAVWQNERLENGDFADKLEFWKKTLSGNENFLALPTDFLRPAVQTFNGNLKEFELNEEIVAAVKKICRDQNVSLFMFFTAVFDILLYRLTGITDINIGTPVANRVRPELEDLIGFFVNTIVLKANINKNSSFIEFLKQVKVNTLDAFSAQEISFEQVVEAVQPVRDLSFSPLFQVMFVYQNTPQAELETVDLQISDVKIPHKSAKFDLTLQMFESANNISASFEYNSDLFKLHTITRFQNCFTELLKNILAEPNKKISEFEVLDDIQKKEIFTISSGEIQNNEISDVVELFEHNARNFPNKIAVETINEKITYAELDKKAAYFAEVLLNKGIQPENGIAVCAKRSTDFVVGLLAVLKTGAAYIPLDPNYPQERLEYILNDSKASFLLTQNEIIDRFPDLQIPFLLLDKPEESSAVNSGNAKLPSTFYPENAAYLIYTSGSTGQPKGVSVSRKNLANSTVARFSVYEKKVGAYLMLSPFAFDSSVAGIFWTLADGGKLVLPPDDFQNDLTKLSDLISKTEATHLLCLPSFYELILQNADKSKLKSLETVIVAGETCFRELTQNHFMILPETRLFNEYGPTENTVWSSVYQCEQNFTELEQIPIGNSIPKVENYVLDDSMKLVPIGVWGELYIGGKGVARGYVGKPALTAEKFVPHPFSTNKGERLYRTGDRVRYLQNGNLEFGGRFDQQIKLRGYRIELGEIERNLIKHQAVSEAVTVVQGIGNEKQLCAFLTLEKDQNLEFPRLRDFLNEFLPDFMIPSRFMILQELPRTANGKVDRKKLSEIKIENYQSNSRLPETETELRIAEIWKNSLKIEKIGVDDNFFQLGGHSLLAGQIAVRMKKEFGTEISLRTIFENPSIGKLSELIENLNDKKASSIHPTKFARSEKIPLSFAQRRLWFLSQMEDQNAVYNVPSVLKINGLPDFSALQKSLFSLIERHEILRTTYHFENGEPFQIIQKDFEFNLERTFSTADSVHEEISKETFKSFDLENEIPIKAHLYTVAENEHFLVLNIHHIATDGHSMEIVTRELAELYEAEKTGKLSEIQPLEWQYADYAVWQQKTFNAEKRQTELEFWRTQLSDAPEFLDLPNDFARPILQSFRGRTLNFTLPENISEHLRKFCRNEDTTPFIALLAVFQILLFRFTRQNDIVTGINFSEREFEEFRPLIGFFVNTLAFRSKMRGNVSFRQFLEETKQNALSVYAHSATPFELLAQELNQTRSLSHAPLFQVMFSLQHEPVTLHEIGGLRFESVGLNNETAKYDLSLSMLTKGDQIFGSFEFNTDIFRQETIENLAKSFVSLAENLTFSADEPIGQVSLFNDKTESEKILSIEKGKSPNENNNFTIAELFKKQAEQTPNATAIEDGENILSFAELDRRSDILALKLQDEFQIETEKTVALLLERSANFVVSMLAVIKCGGVFLPIDPDYPTDRIRYLLNDAEVSVVLYDAETEDTAVNFKQDVSLLNSGEISGDFHQTDSKIQTQNAAYVIYTSGTTGNPKGVSVTYENLLNLVLAAQDNYALTPNDRVLWFSSPAFDVSIEEILPSLVSGSSLIVRRDSSFSSFEEFWKFVEERQLSVLNLPSSFWHQSVSEAVKRSSELPSKLRLLIAGSERIDPQAISDWEAFAGSNVKLINAYGPTETTVTATTYQISEQSQNQRVSIGRAIQNAEIYVLDENFALLPIGFVGELCIGGKGVTRGYVGKPGMTAEKFVPHPFSTNEGERLYRTGDLARILPDGNIDLLGRIDEQIKIRGFRIEPAEIETQIRLIDDIKQVVVTVSENNGEESLTAFIESNSKPDIEKIKRKLRAKLPQFMIPQIIELAEIPKLPNGKTDLRALKKHKIEATTQTLVLPESKIEKALAEIWKDVLNTEKFGIDDNFFDLGGHSLLLLKVNSALKEKIKANLPIVDLFRFPTIRTLAEHLENNEKTDNEIQKQAAERAANRRRMMTKRTSGGR